MDPLSIAMLGATGANFISNLLGGRSQNDQRERLIGQGTEAANYFRGQGITDPQNYISSAYNPLLNFSQGVLGDGNMAQWLNDFLAQNRQGLLDQQGNLRQYSQPGDLQPYYQSPMGDVGRSYDPVNNFLQQQLFNMPQSGAYGDIIARMTELGNGQNQGNQALLERGNNLMDSFGNTADNMSALERAGSGMAANGMNPELRQLMSAGNDLFSTGGMNPQIQAILAASGGAAQNGGMTPQFQELFNTGQGLTQNGGMNQPLQQLFSAGQGVQQQGGYTPNLSAMSRQGTEGLAGFMPGGANQATQQSQLGQYGNQALQQLLTPSSRNIDSGYTSQNMGVGEIGFEGLQQLLARDPQIDQVSAFGQQAFGGKLPGGGSSYDDILSSLVSRMGGGGGGFSGVSGGGASGASAGSMGPVDPKMAAMIDEALKYVQNNPLIPMEQRISMAIDQAGSAASQSAEAAQRFARARGGGGAIVNSGNQNQAMVDFADQALRNRSTSIREAMLDQQNLGLQQQLGMGQLGIGAQNADTNRQQVAASRDIASANNATSASIANSNSSTQAGIANAQIQAAQMQAALQAALGARGQEYGQSQAGLQAMLAAQGLANDRGQIFNTAMLGGLNDATQRYGINAGLEASLAGTDAQQRATALQGSLGASGQANDYNLGMSNILAQLGLGAEGQATTRQGQGFGAMGAATGTAAQNAATGVGAMGAAGQLGNQRLSTGISGMGAGADLAGRNVGMGIDAMGRATQQAGQNLGTWGQIGSSASNDQLQRILAGAGMVQNNVGNQISGLNLAGNATNSMNNSLINAGQLWNQTQGAQNNIWQQMFDNDYRDRALGASTQQGINSSNLALGGLGGQYAGLATNPLSQIGSTMTNYAGQQQGNYASLIQSLLGQSPKPQNPWPQVNIQPGQWGGSGGSGGYNSGLSNFDWSTLAGGGPSIGGLIGGGGSPGLMTPPFVQRP